MKIHGHPQKTDYAADGSDWPTISAQAHWLQPAGLLMPIPNVPQYMQNASHTHVDLTFPVYAENDGTPFQVNFTIKLFHTPGKITRIDSINMRDIVWDATGTTTPPDLTGDPMMLKQWTGHATVDITLPGDNTAPKRGWCAAELAVQTSFSTGLGDNTETMNLLPLYSVIDQNAPETWNYHMVGAHANAGSSNPAQVPATQWGVVFVQYPDYLPIAPISQPWTAQVGMDSYGGTTLPPALYEHRHTIDIHNGIPGVLDGTATMAQAGGLSETVVFDPAVLGPGTQNNAVIFNQPDRIQQLTVLSVINVTVDPNAPPPKPLIAVPNVVGMVQSAAFNTLGMAGFGTSVTSDNDPIVPAGTVVSQSPSAGVMQTSGTIVSIIVSAGPAMSGLMVPNVTGMTCAQATVALAAVGLVGISDPVTSQTPAAGTIVPVGSSVTIVC